MLSNSWMERSSTSNLKGHDLSRLFYSLRINNPLSLNTNFIDSVNNTTADTISRIYPSRFCILLHLSYIGISGNNLLSTLPPQSRAAVLPRARVSIKARYRSTSVRNLGIFDLRQQFHLADLIPIVKLDHNPLLEIIQEDMNLIIAVYTTFLLTGYILLCMCIKVGTAKIYLKTATKVFLDNNQWYPAIIRTGDSVPVLKALFHNTKRWESMPNRQEPVTIETN